MTTLDFAYSAQKRLAAARIPSVVAGVWALNYHGVDIVMHDMEICVPSALIEDAAGSLRAERSSYEQLSDCNDPDLYHCYRQGSKRFRLLRSQSPLDLFVVGDDMLGMSISSTTMERGLTAEMAHEELREYCEGVQADILAELVWPSLAACLQGWLNLSAKSSGMPDEIIYLMYAEKLIDSNDMSKAWLKKNLHGASVVERGRKLLASKDMRIRQNEWS